MPRFVNIREIPAQMRQRVAAQVNLQSDLKALLAPSSSMTPWEFTNLLIRECYQQALLYANEPVIYEFYH